MTWQELFTPHFHVLKNVLHPKNQTISKQMGLNKNVDVFHIKFKALKFHILNQEHYENQNNMRT